MNERKKRAQKDMRTREETNHFSHLTNVPQLIIPAKLFAGFFSIRINNFFLAKFISP
jgi:hypothetical protein